MADNTNRLAGLAFLSVDGQSYALAGEFQYDVSNVNRESVAGADGVHGYKEMPKVGKISAQLRDTGGLSNTQLNNMTNVTVICELANGKVVVGRNMWTVDPQSVNTADATVTVNWEGPDVSEN
jgi:hypothetical protein